MSKRSEGNLFVGRLSKNTRVRDLEDIFEPYGRVTRCDIKYGAEMAYAFVDFEDRRDAEDARRHENDQELCGAKIVVEFAKGQRRRSLGEDECFRCQRTGHWASDCPDDRAYGYRKPGRSNNGRGRNRSPSPKRQRRLRSHERSRSRSPKRDDRQSRSSRSPDRQRRRNKDPSRSPDGKRSRSPSAKESNRNDRGGNKNARHSHSSSESDD